jgi:hypothetical protein
MPTRAEQEKMQAQQDAVEEFLETAEDKADSFFSNLLNPAAEQISGAVKVARERFRSWVDDSSTSGKKRWALAGFDDRGRSYTVREWQEHGQEIASLLSTTVGLHWAGSVENAITEPVNQSTQQVVEVAEDVAEVAEELAEAAGGLVEDLRDAAEAVGKPWPWHVKAGLVAGGVTLGLMGLSYGVRPFLALAKVAK